MALLLHYYIALTSVGVVGILANTLQMVFLRKEKGKKTSFQITIFSLSIADFSVSLILVYSGLYFIAEEMNLFTKSQEFLRIFLANLTFCQQSSFFHILFIAVERLMAVFYPLRFQFIFTRKVCIVSLLIIWALSFALSFTAVSDLKYLYKPVTIISGVSLICSYMAICIKLFKRRNSVIVRTASENSNAAYSRTVTQSLAVTIAFIICTMPYLFTTNDDHPLMLMFARVMIVGNVLLNPIVYFLFAHCKRKFRRFSTAASLKQRRQPAKGKACNAVMQRVSSGVDSSSLKENQCSGVEIELSPVKKPDTSL